jgi:membrane-anchored protein YejM (alkaline phosphatase superfamily)
MVAFESKSYSKRLLHLISWSHWFTFFNIVVAIILSALYVFAEPTPNTFSGNLYLYTTWFSHMGFLTFIGYVLILFPIILIYPRTRFIRTTASILYATAMVFLLLDAFVYSRLGYHLNASSSDQIIQLIGSLIAHNSLKFWLIVCSTSLLMLALQLAASNYAWKHLKDLQSIKHVKMIVIGFVGAFFTSHFVHIWADAKLDYSVLRQDMVLPLSYPATAQTLLNKYGLFDESDYLARRTNTLELGTKSRLYPQFTEQCNVKNTDKQSVVMVLTKSILKMNQINNFSLKSSASNIKLNHHIDNALLNNAWFNLLYSLPTTYKNNILQQGKKPLLFQAVNANNIETSLTVVGRNSLNKQWFYNWFETKTELADISSLIFTANQKDFTEKLNQKKSGLHVFYFEDEQPGQFELFIDALLLAQRQKSQQDIIWVSSIGNDNRNDSLSIKPSLLIVPNAQSNRLRRLTSHMDIQPTLLTQWLGCEQTAKSIVNGKDVVSLDHNRVIANTMDSGLVVFNKDKSIFIDSQGEFESYSRQLKAPIAINSDFPMMIDGVKFIKRFSQSQQPATSDRVN